MFSYYGNILYIFTCASDWGIPDCCWRGQTLSCMVFHFCLCTPSARCWVLSSEAHVLPPLFDRCATLGGGTWALVSRKVAIECSNCRVDSHGFLLATFENFLCKVARMSDEIQRTRWISNRFHHIWSYLRITKLMTSPKPNQEIQEPTDLTLIQHDVFRIWAWF